MLGLETSLVGSRGDLANSRIPPGEMSGGLAEGMEGGRTRSVGELKLIKLYSETMVGKGPWAWDMGERVGVSGCASDSQARIWSGEAMGPPKRSPPLEEGPEETRGGVINGERVVVAAEAGAVGDEDGGIEVGTSTCKGGRGLECEDAQGREDSKASAVAGRTLRRMLFFRCGGDSIVSTATACSEVLSREVTGRNKTALGGRDAGFAFASHMLIADKAFSGGSCFGPLSATRKA